jgi:hypothetical protein
MQITIFYYCTWEYDFIINDILNNFDKKIELFNKMIY